jgi:hypothetical protein
MDSQRRQYSHPLDQQEYTETEIKVEQFYQSLHEPYRLLPPEAIVFIFSLTWQGRMSIGLSWCPSDKSITLDISANRPKIK